MNPTISTSPAHTQGKGISRGGDLRGQVLEFCLTKHVLDIMLELRSYEEIEERAFNCLMGEETARKASQRG